MSELLRRASPELPSDFDPNHFVVLLRHGQPDTYAATDSPLSEEGKKQVTEFGQLYVASLAQQEEVYLSILFSDRPRTHQSATLLWREIQRLRDEGAASNIAMGLINEIPAPALLTTDTLGPLIDNRGVDKEEAYTTWLMLNPQILKRMNARTPHEVYLSMMNFIRDKRDIGRSINMHRPEASYHYIGITHETTLGAMAQQLHIPHTGIGFAEAMIFGIDPSYGVASVDFRNKRYSLLLD